MPGAQVGQRLAGVYEAQLAKALAAQARELQARAADALAAERLQRIRAIDEARGPAPARAPCRVSAVGRKASVGTAASQPSAHCLSVDTCPRAGARPLSKLRADRVQLLAASSTPPYWDGALWRW